MHFEDFVEYVGRYDRPSDAIRRLSKVLKRREVEVRRCGLASETRPQAA